MIKKVSFKGVFNQPKTFNYNEELNIMIGDNGAGKTTIKNLLIQILTLQPIILWSSKFEEITIDFFDNDYSLRRITCIHEYEENLLNKKGNKSTKSIEFQYEFQNRKLNFNINFNDKYTTVNQHDTEYRYLTELDDDLSYANLIIRTIDNEAIASVLKDLKQSVIYLPTYRRIDWDIFRHVKNEVISSDFIKHSFSKNRTVIGTTHADMEEVLNRYTNNVKSKTETYFEESLDKSVSTVIQEMEKNYNDLNSGKIKNAENFEEILKRINSYMVAMKHYEKMRSNFKRFDVTLKRYFKINFKLDAQKADEFDIGKQWRSLSTGEKQILTILLYSLVGFEETGFRKLVLIDEPEISLHINWQINFIEGLKNIHEGQIILSTHSPYIADIKYISSVIKVGELSYDG